MTDPQTAVAIATPSAVAERVLDEFPEDRYNRLIPTQTIRMPSDLLVPVVQIVKLSLNEADKDVYKSHDVPANHKALTARGLNKVATAAGLSFFDERRVDDGSDPDVIGVTVMAELLLPTGQKITAPGTKWVNLKTQPFSTDAQRNKYRSFFYEHVSTRARNRAIRAILSLKSSYTEAELARPFAVVSFAPNMNHPLIQQRMVDNLAPAVQQLYGGGAAPGQIGPGEPVTKLPEIPADDEPAEGQARDVTPEGDGEEPAWMRTGAAAAAPVPTEAPTTDLASTIREAATAGGLTGPAKEPQIAGLRGIFGALGGRATTAGLRAIWPELDVDKLSANQAQAIIGTARQFPDDEEVALAWRAMAGIEAAS